MKPSHTKTRVAPHLPAESSPDEAGDLPGVEAGAGEGVPPGPVRVGRLDTAESLRIELARLYRAGRRGDIAPADASRLASILELIRRSLDASDHEQRLRMLEQRLAPSAGSASLNRRH